MSPNQILGLIFFCTFGIGLAWFLLAISGTLPYIMFWQRRCWLMWRYLLLGWRVARIKSRAKYRRQIAELESEIAKEKQELVTLAFTQPHDFLGEDR